MKKSAWIILTIVASLMLNNCSERTNPQNVAPNYSFMEAEESSDTTRYYNQQPMYDYYYQSRFWNSLFRLFRPHRYHQLITQQGYMPRRIRVTGSRDHSHHGPVSHTRGGFGHTGGWHPIAG